MEARILAGDITLEKHGNFLFEASSILAKWHRELCSLTEFWHEEFDEENIRAGHIVPDLSHREAFRSFNNQAICILLRLVLDRYGAAALSGKR